jgi:hypothetical protein
VDRHISTVEHGNLLLIVIDRNDLMSKFGEASSSYKSDVPGANNSNSQAPSNR